MPSDNLSQLSYPRFLMAIAAYTIVAWGAFGVVAGLTTSWDTAQSFFVVGAALFAAGALIGGAGYSITYFTEGRLHE